jgi:hypothetical protein
VRLSIILSIWSTEVYGSIFIFVGNAPARTIGISFQYSWYGQNMKFAIFIDAPEPQNRAPFLDWFSREYLPGMLSAAPSCCGCVIRRELVRSSMPDWAAAPTDKGQKLAPSDVVLELWFPSTEDFRREILTSEKRLRKAGAHFLSLCVVPRLQKDPRFAEAGPHGARPGVTLVAPIKWRTDVTAEFGAARWQQHTAIALRSQPVLTKYEQNVVKEVISWTSGTPAIDAYADFSFASLDDMVSRFIFTEEEGQDISNFVGSFQAVLYGDAEPGVPRR